MSEQRLHQDPVLIEIRVGQMRSPHHSLLIRPYLLSQSRLILCDIRHPDDHAQNGHGRIVREMCTYRPEIARMVAQALVESADPEEFCRRLERPYNCEAPGQRIRLDNRPEDRPEDRPERGDKTYARHAFEPEAD